MIRSIANLALVAVLAAVTVAALTAAAGGPSLAATAGSSRPPALPRHGTPRAPSTTTSAVMACTPGTSCNDGNACTLHDTCNAQGVCAGTLPPPTRFCSTGTVTIPSVGPATPYPSTMSISAGPTLCAVTRFDFQGITHTFPDDLDVLLVGPSGQNAKIMSDVGGSGDLFGLFLAL